MPDEDEDDSDGDSSTEDPDQNESQTGNDVDTNHEVDASNPEITQSRGEGRGRRRTLVRGVNRGRTRARVRARARGRVRARARGNAALPTQQAPLVTSEYAQNDVTDASVGQDRGRGNRISCTRGRSLRRPLGRAVLLVAAGSVAVFLVQVHRMGHMGRRYFS